MTTTNRLRAGLLATAAGAGLVLAGSAAALEYNVGSVKITFDTTISLGGSMRVADRNEGFLPEANGGNRDPRSGTGGTVISNTAPGGFGLQAPVNLAGQVLPSRVTVTVVLRPSQRRSVCSAYQDSRPRSVARAA